MQEITKRWQLLSRDGAFLTGGLCDSDEHATTLAVDWMRVHHRKMGNLNVIAPSGIVLSRQRIRL